MAYTYLCILMYIYIRYVISTCMYWSIECTYMYAYICMYIYIYNTDSRIVKLKYECLMDMCINIHSYHMSNIFLHICIYVYVYVYETCDIFVNLYIFMYT